MNSGWRAKSFIVFREKIHVLKQMNQRQIDKCKVVDRLGEVKLYVILRMH